MDFIHTHKQVGHRRLVHYRENYQDNLLAVLDRGLQMEMDINKPGDTMVIKHAIGYHWGQGLVYQASKL